MHEHSIISSAYVVSGQPHILLGHEQSKKWHSLFESYGDIRKEIENTDADLILYFSTGWLSVLGHMFQADPNPKWVQVDQNFHHLGSIEYEFKIDTDFAGIYKDEVSGLGYHTSLVNYHGFPIDTGTIVAQKLLNPQNRLPASMVSCNMYAEKEESLLIGQAAAHALTKAKKKAIVVLVSNLSNRFETRDVVPEQDEISSLKDDEWNQKILEMLGKGELEDVSQCAREFARQANADMGFKGIWWLAGLTGQTNNFRGKIFDYQPVWGTGAGLAGLYPTEPVEAADYDTGSEEGSQANMVAGLTERNQGQKKASQETDTKAVHRTKKVVASKTAPEPVGAYPHARQIGDLVYLSGIGPRQRGSREIPGVTLTASGEIESYDVRKQTQAVIDNVRLVLKDCGLALKDVIDIQVFLTNMKSDFSSFNEVYGQTFSATDGPTRTTVEVGSLPTPIAVEFKVIARARG